jgi:hypothetical protein
MTKGFDKKAIQHFINMLKDSDEDFIRWAIQIVLDWNRSEIKSENLIHIHGTKDFIFPLKNIKNCDYIVNGGTHDMIMTSAAEINEILKKEIDS